jgi:hypothetical protein
MTDRLTASTINDTQLDGLYAEIDRLTAELDDYERRVVTLEHVAAGNKRHVQLIVPDLERAEAAIERVRHLHRPVGVVAAAEFGEAPECAACQRSWPCQTYNAVTEPAPSGPAIPASDDSDPADLTGYIAPDPPIGCLNLTAGPDPDDWPSRRTGLRDQLAAALYERERPPREPRWAEAYPCDREVFEAMADTARTVLYREWPWLRAEAEDAATETAPANPPGSTAEQLPEALLALIRDRLPDYTSTACQTADTLACTATYRRHPLYDEIRENAERLHSRCRLNNRFTGQLCACGCHGPEELS